MSLKNLIDILNSTVRLGGASVSEGVNSHVVITNLAAMVGAQIKFELDAMGWSYYLEDRFDRPLPPGSVLTALDEPYLLTINKPSSPRKRFLSLSGFVNWLQFNPSKDVVEVAGCLKSFSTESFVVAEWDGGHDMVLNISDELKSPKEIVREHGIMCVPEDLRPYLLNRKSSPEWGDKVFQSWAKLSAKMLCSSLASTIHADGTLRFGGPPVLETPACQDSEFTELAASGFKALQDSVRWVYENPREAETKHGFLSIEIARSPSSLGSESTYGLFSKVLVHAYESAVLAHRLSLSKISGDTLRSLNDLRKALADEASKASDVARQVYSGIAAAVFASVGVAIARVTGNAPAFAVRALAAVIAIYLIGLAISAYFQKSNQASFRNLWRSHLYRFLSDADYENMVSDPAKTASLPLTISMILAFFSGFLLFLILWNLPSA